MGKGRKPNKPDIARGIQERTLIEEIKRKDRIKLKSSRNTKR